MKTTAFKHIATIAQNFASIGIKNVIISPGSRCAALIIAFNRHPKFKCFTIVDERSAAFYALGIAQQTEKPVVLICTSGTALLNYAPAIAEAFYQKIPLIVLSADRPENRINKNDGQTLNQQNVFQNFIKKSVQLKCNPIEKNDIESTVKLAIQTANESLNFPFGPVHINVPFQEPLYEIENYNNSDLDILDKIKKPNSLSKSINVDEAILNNLKTAWQNAESKLIIIGQINHPTTALQNILNKINEQNDVLIFAETTSNLPNENFFNQYDRIAFAINETNKNLIKAQIIITIGEAIVSKKIKQVLSNVDCKNIFHIGFSNQNPSPFAETTTQIKAEDSIILEQLSLQNKSKKNLKKALTQFDNQLNIKQLNYIKKIEWSDFKVMNFIYNNLPSNCNLQLGNSTPVRYSNLFKIKASQNINVFSNRGVSGIDGQISTAAGAALVSNKLTICICGDLSFFYDSNAFWNNHLPKNLKVVLINNEGGGIFRFINGPSEIEELEPFFEAKHKTSAQFLCKGFEVSYLKANNLQDLANNWSTFLETENCTALEINTNGKYTGEVLKNYFKLLSNP